MRRKNLTKKRYVLKSKRDPFYNSLWLNKFSNHFIKAGKKFLIEKAFFQSFGSFKQMKKWKQMPFHKFGIYMAELSVNNFSFNLQAYTSPFWDVSFFFSVLTYLFALRAYNVRLSRRIEINSQYSTVTKIITFKPLHILLRHFIKNKALFHLVSKRLGSRVITIPIPLSSHLQLLYAMRQCAREIKVLRFVNNLERRIYNYLINCLSSGRTLWVRERDKKIKTITANRTNLRYRWR